MHEDLVRKQVIATSSDRAFGFTMAAVLTAFGAWPLVGGGAPRWWSLAIAVTLFAITLIAAPLLAPFNRAWSKFGELLGRVVSPLALGALFYLVFTPIGVYLRMAGKASMRLPFDQSARSYWVERDPPGPPPGSLTNQF